MEMKELKIVASKKKLKKAHNNLGPPNVTFGPPFISENASQFWPPNITLGPLSLQNGLPQKLSKMAAKNITFGPPNKTNRPPFKTFGFPL